MKMVKGLEFALENNTIKRILITPLHKGGLRSRLSCFFDGYYTILVSDETPEYVHNFLKEKYNFNAEIGE